MRLSWSKERQNTKKIWWSSEHPVVTSRQQRCNIISGRISCLSPNSRAENTENIEDTFYLYFDNYIRDKIVDCTKTRINETKHVCSEEITSMNQASTHGSNKQTELKFTRYLD